MGSMKLYLSSYRVPTPLDLQTLAGKPLSECRTVIIPNAKDYKLPNERAQKLDELYADLAGLSIRADIIDLRDYESRESLAQALAGCELMWVAGGNTYVLRSEMQRSGFDQIITGLLDTGMVYCGESAGAIVAGTSLQGFDVADDPELADELIWEGLGLVDKIIAPHMDNQQFIEYANHIKKFYLDSPQVIYLNDNQAWIVNGSEQTLSTA